MSDDLRARLLYEIPAVRSAAEFVEQYARRCGPHTEAVADCPVCSLLFLVKWAREAASALAVTVGEEHEKDDVVTRRDTGTPLEGLPAASTDTKGSE